MGAMKDLAIFKANPEALAGHLPPEQIAEIEAAYEVARAALEPAAEPATEVAEPTPAVEPEAE